MEKSQIKNMRNFKNVIDCSIDFPMFHAMTIKTTKIISLTFHSTCKICGKSCFGTSSCSSCVRNFFQHNFYLLRVPHSSSLNPNSRFCSPAVSNGLQLQVVYLFLVKKMEIWFVRPILAAWNDNGFRAITCRSTNPFFTTAGRIHLPPKWGA